MFKDRLKEARMAAGMTQAQLAKEVGVAKSTLAGYETGNSEPDLAKMEKIMEALHVDANYLWQDEANDKGGFANRLSYEELNLLQKYRSLDEWGKRAIDAIMLVEEQRCSSREHRPMTTAELKARAANVPILKELSEKLTEKSV